MNSLFKNKNYISRALNISIKIIQVDCGGGKKEIFLEILFNLHIGVQLAHPKFLKWQVFIRFMSQ